VSDNTSFLLDTNAVIDAFRSKGIKKKIDEIIQGNNNHLYYTNLSIKEFRIALGIFNGSSLEKEVKEIFSSIKHVEWAIPEIKELAEELLKKYAPGTELHYPDNYYLALAKKHDFAIITNDYNLAKICKKEGIDRFDQRKNATNKIWTGKTRPSGGAQIAKKREDDEWWDPLGDIGWYEFDDGCYLAFDDTCKFVDKFLKKFIIDERFKENFCCWLSRLNDLVEKRHQRELTSSYGAEDEESIKKNQRRQNMMNEVLVKNLVQVDQSFQKIKVSVGEKFDSKYPVNRKRGEEDYEKLLNLIDKDRNLYDF
tara:strand:+ start:92 stop:1021 length:930 start_codon:yes stop_codon:yes gene_type:complete